ncbi:S-layer family protein [Pseudomonas sp. GL93]|uniref:beta strand repeat-containing protein n=1 Tax=Pseudomonas sp. GL93 TaxID=2014741 RepID=UPI001C49B8C1|nr:Ig-like domain-containing protein [Pseudomonas sp. GL93]
MDSVAPSAVIAITSITTDSGTSATDYITNDQTLVFNGTLGAALATGEKAQISLNGGTTWLDSSVTGTTWSYDNQATNLAEGSYNVQVRVIDAAGNVGTTASQSVVVDLTPPSALTTIAITSISSDSGVSTTDYITNDKTLVFNGSLGAALAASERAQISLNGGTTWLNSSVTGTTWSYDNQATNLADGTYNVLVRVIDVAGNVGQTASQNVVVDTTPPSATVVISNYTDDYGSSTGNFGTATVTDDHKPVLNGTISAAPGVNEVVRIYADSVMVGTATVVGTNWSFNLPGLSEGAHTFMARVEDLAGNLGASSTNFTLTEDYSFLVTSQTTTDTTPLVTGTMPFPLSDGEYIQVVINGVTYSSANGGVVVDPDNQTWYVQTPAGNALALGTYQVAATVYSSLGAVLAADDTVGELIVGAISATTVNGDTAAIAGPGMAVGDVNNDGRFDYFNGNTSTSSGGDINFGSATTSWDASSFINFDFYNYGNDISPVNTLGRVSAVNFLDFDRSGNLSIMLEDSALANNVHFYKNSGGVLQQTNYSPASVSSGAGYLWGGQVGLDLDNDGFIDLLHGDKAGDSSYYSINNKSGSFTSYDTSNTNGVDGGSFGRFGADVGAFDFNGDGRVDLAGQLANVSGGGWGDANDLTVLFTGSDGSSALRAGVIGNPYAVTANVLAVKTTSSITDFQAGAQTMNFADFNGDGNLDLFIGQNVSSLATSMVYTGNGSGGFAGSALSGSTLVGGVSVNTDWNADGKLDVFEFADNGANGPTLATNTTYEYWQNTTATAGGTPTFVRTAMTVTDVPTATSIIGAAVADFNYDGAQDLVINANGADVLRLNTNVVADGTSLHLKIVNPNGYNTYVSQNVKLYNEAGTLVATSVINGQYGYGTTDSRGIVDFYGLNANETYTAVLVKAGITGIDGGLGSIGGEALGGVVASGVNTTWDDLKAGPASSGYVLSAEATTGNNNGTFVGTGYNDTFFASAGTDTYRGAGGSTFVSGERLWSSSGGMDVVDFTTAGNTGVTVNLSNAAAQNTGYNTATFASIEGLKGGNGVDSFTDSSADNQFEGRGGNDTFQLVNGGHDTLIYNLLTSANATGGNGTDTVVGFKVGTFEATPNSDRIDLRQLLVGYTADADGAAHYVNGTATIDVGETIQNYLSTTNSGGNTTLSIDRDGTAGTYAPTQLLTMTGVTTDLAKLLANHQITLV